MDAIKSMNEMTLDEMESHPCYRDGYDKPNSDYPYEFATLEMRLWNAGRCDAITELQQENRELKVSIMQLKHQRATLARRVEELEKQFSGN